MSAYEDAVDRAVHAGFFLARDADDIKAAAAATASDVFAEPGASAG